MVASASTGSSFGDLAGYLGGGEERVGWVETRNVFADDVPGTVAEMREQAALSSKCEKPVYHVTIAFDPSDNLTEAELRGAVDRTLRDVGLEDHQALVVRHVDRDHAHVHVMVNRVGPDGRAWSTSQDRLRLRASVERQERELGVRWTGRNARAAGVAHETDRGFAREVRDRALGDLREAPTWADLDIRLQAKGLRIERRGRGAVVTDGKREAKLSSVSRTVSRPRLEARLGSLAAHQHSPDEARRARQLDGPARNRGRASGHRAARQRQRRSGTLRRNAFRSRRLGQVVGRAVADGERDADEVFARTVLQTGSRAVLGAAGRGRRVASGEERGSRERRAPASHAGRTYEARARARDARRGGRVDRVERAVHDHARTARLVAEREKALRVVARIEEKAARAVTAAQKELSRAQARAADAKRAFGVSMSNAYAEPSEAAQTFLRAAQSDGVDRAVQRMAVDPERYGALKSSPSTSRYSLVRATTTEPARTVAPLAAKHGRAFVEARQAVQKAESAVRRAGEIHRTVSSELSGVQRTARRVSADEFGPGAVRARLERLERSLRDQRARAPGVRLTPARLDGSAGKALASRIGSVGVATAARAVKTASQSLGRGE